MKMVHIGDGYFMENGLVTAPALFQYDPARNMEAFLDKLKDIMQWAVPLTAVTSAMNAFTSRALAAAPEAVVATAKTSALWVKFQPLIHMVQDFALPVGVIVATWGLIEIIMGNRPSGKEKLKYSIIGYIGIFVIPMVFEAIRAAFMA